jgi:vacuolar-type H+-ATPase subunit I/STV1
MIKNGSVDREAPGVGMQCADLFLRKCQSCVFVEMFCGISREQLERKGKKMSLEKSQKIVKVLGILAIISAVVSLLAAVGLLGLGGVGVATIDSATDEQATGVAVVFFLGIVLLVTGVVDLLEGIFSLRAAKDASKAGPLWVFSIIGLVLAAIAVIASLMNGGQSLGSDICTLLINGGIFYLANNIKKLGA